MNTLYVELGNRRYPVHIGAGLLGRPELLLPHLAQRQVLLISNERVAPLYLAPVCDNLRHLRVETLILPDGEQHKTLAAAAQIFDVLLDKRFGRDCVLLALGGGVIGDITGFAAACYQRGVDFIQLPTTLLGQVDAAIGGKTAVNHPRGKNIIGAFHQPRCVIADIATLTTLDVREYRAGLAEIIKYAVVADQAFFIWLEDNLERLKQREIEALLHAITRSCEIKAVIVSRDERESGSRALLNLGHTFGHAIETGLGYGKWLHGEAVAAGMVMAARVATILGSLNDTDAQRIENLLAAAGLPVRKPPELDWPMMRELMQHDKKILNRQLRLVLPTAIGKAMIVNDVGDDVLERAVNG